MRRLDCHDRIKQALSSYQTALRTVEAMITIVISQPQQASLLDRHFALPDLRSLAAELHDIYFTRMFACFESGLRDYWRTRVRDTRPLTEQLLSSLAGRFGVPQDTLDAVHEIRSFRNYLIHEEHEVEKRFTIEEASKHLNTYLARLPLAW
jgi:hypothetical protein